MIYALCRVTTDIPDIVNVKLRISAAKASISEYDQRKNDFSPGADVHNVLQRFAKGEKITFQDVPTLAQPAAEPAAEPAAAAVIQTEAETAMHELHEQPAAETPAAAVAPEAEVSAAFFAPASPEPEVNNIFAW